MLSVTADRRIWLCTRPTDMRCSFNGLSTIVRQHLRSNPTSGDWFVFVNRRCTQLKILAFEHGGYCLWSKRLEQGQFAAPGGGEDNRLALSRVALLALLEGVDMVITRQRKRFRIAA